MNKLLASRTIPFFILLFMIISMTTSCKKKEDNKTLLTLAMVANSGFTEKRLGGTSSDGGYSISSDSSGNVYVTGYVTGAADLNGDGDTSDPGESATGYGSLDIFIIKFNSSGLPL